MELVKKSFIVLILLMIIPVVTSIEVGITDGEPQIGIDLIPDTLAFNNNTGSVNDSTYWQGWTPTTYYDSIKLLFDATYCLLVGCTMQGDIDMNDNQILDAGNIISNENITADTYFGDGSELTGTMDYTNVALINQTNTFTKNQTMTGTRNQLGLNFWSCQLTPTSNLILTANLTKSIADGKC